MHKCLSRSHPLSGKIVMVRSPGFEPGSSGWEPDILTKLNDDRPKTQSLRCTNINKNDIDWTKYKQWLTKKYSYGYTRNCFGYAKKYSHLLFQTQEINNIEETRINNVIDALTALSKYIGYYEQFKHNLKNAGIKRKKQDCLQSFLRILNCENKNVLKWLNDEAMPQLRPNEKIFAKFLKLSGLRVSEGIEAFNLCIKLHKENKLNEYYNIELSILCHFKYKQFLRRKKNAFITFITTELLNEICNCKPTTYNAILRNLEKKHIKLRFNELRDLFGTTLVNNGITETEQNLVCGRIPTSVFVRHYWSPKLKELGTRIFKAIQKIDNPNKTEPAKKETTEEGEWLSLFTNNQDEEAKATENGWQFVRAFQDTTKALYRKRK